LRLAVVDLTVGINGNNNVLVDEGQIVVWCVDVSTGKTVHFPWPRSNKALTLNYGEGLNQSGIISSGFPSDEPSVV
jgi:hypothetical protein